MTQNREVALGTVRVDPRNRVYLKSVVKNLPAGALYMVSVAEPATVESGEAPKTIRMRLVES